jgi:hypothetical protein
MDIGTNPSLSLFYSQHFNDFISVRECSGISPPYIVFNSNKRSDSRAPQKEKLNKPVILYQPANSLTGHSDNKTDFLRILTIYKS